MEKVQTLGPRGGHARLAGVAAAAALCIALASCGGGSGSSTDTSGSTPPANEPVSKAESARFLTQASFGPTEAEIDAVATTGYAAWLEAQFAKPQALHRSYLNQASADLAATGGTISDINFYDSWWSQAIAGEDQFRQRATFALSQIFVVSFADATLRNQPRGVSSYYDMLAANAFGNFRDLLQSVALHPMMGVYLSHLKNQKEDAATGRVPDLNFAREITQLFTVGQYKLNADGSNVLGSDGNGAGRCAGSRDELWAAGPCQRRRGGGDRRAGGRRKPCNAHPRSTWSPRHDRRGSRGGSVFLSNFNHLRLGCGGMQQLLQYWAGVRISV